MADEARKYSYHPHSAYDWNFTTLVKVVHTDNNHIHHLARRPPPDRTTLPNMSRMSKAQKLMLDATRTPVEPTPLMKLVRLPIIDSVSRLKNGDGSVALSSDVKSLEMRYYPKHSSNGVKWVPISFTGGYRILPRWPKAGTS